jgi:hypothetical protein
MLTSIDHRLLGMHLRSDQKQESELAGGVASDKAGYPRKIHECLSKSEMSSCGDA